MSGLSEKSYDDVLEIWLQDLKTMATEQVECVLQYRKKHMVSMGRCKIGFQIWKIIHALTAPKILRG